MNKKAVLSAFTALAVLTGQVAIAEPGEGPNSPRPQQEQRREESRDHRDHDVYRNNRDNRDYGYERRNERGFGPAHNFHRGERLPNEFHSRHYIVENWRAHGLLEPPYGYHWVQVGGDYLLVAIATGVILNMLVNH